MSTISRNDINKYIEPLKLNGLSGRVLRLPAPAGKTRELLFVYGQHSSLERWWGLAQEINNYGALTMPDLPGFGGMDSLYAIGQPATIDNLADWLADFIKANYKTKKVTILGMSLGFVITTRMLQRHPQLVDRIESLVSVVGLANSDDFAFTKKRLFLYELTSKIFAGKLSSALFRAIALQPFVLRRVYHRTFNAKEKFAHISTKADFDETMNMEIGLWHANDIRTQFKTYTEMFDLDNCRVRVKLPLYHIAVENDRYLDKNRVEEHLMQIFDSVEIFYTDAPNHAPTIIATVEEARGFIPDELKRRIFTD